MLTTDGTDLANDLGDGAGVGVEEIGVVDGWGDGRGFGLGCGVVAD